MENKPVSPIGDSWEKVRDTISTPEERVVTDIEIDLLGEIITSRQT